MFELKHFRSLIKFQSFALRTVFSMKILEIWIHGKFNPLFRFLNLDKIVIDIALIVHFLNFQGYNSKLSIATTRYYFGDRGFLRIFQQRYFLFISDDRVARTIREQTIARTFTTCYTGGNKGLLTHRSPFYAYVSKRYHLKHERLRVAINIIQLRIKGWNDTRLRTK